MNALEVLERDRVVADDFRCTGTLLHKIEAAEYMAIRAEVAQAHEAVSFMIAVMRRIEEGCSFPDNNVLRAIRDQARAALTRIEGAA